MGCASTKPPVLPLSSLPPPSSPAPVPPFLVCPLIGATMRDPVMTRSGHTYDRTAIEAYLSRDPRDPVTDEPASLDELSPNMAIRAALRDYCPGIVFPDVPARRPGGEAPPRPTRPAPVKQEAPTGGSGSGTGFGTRTRVVQAVGEQRRMDAVRNEATSGSQSQGKSEATTADASRIMCSLCQTAPATSRARIDSAFRPVCAACNARRAAQVPTASPVRVVQRTSMGDEGGGGSAVDRFLQGNDVGLQSGNASSAQHGHVGHQEQQRQHGQSTTHTQHAQQAQQRPNGQQTYPTHQTHQTHQPHQASSNSNSFSTTSTAAPDTSQRSMGAVDRFLQGDPAADRHHESNIPVPRQNDVGSNSGQMFAASQGRGPGRGSATGRTGGPNATGAQTSGQTSMGAVDRFLQGGGDDRTQLVDRESKVAVPRGSGAQNGGRDGGRTSTVPRTAAGINPTTSAAGQYPQQQSPQSFSTGTTAAAGRPTAREQMQQYAEEERKAEERRRANAGNGGGSSTSTSTNTNTSRFVLNAEYADDPNDDGKRNDDGGHWLRWWCRKCECKTFKGTFERSTVCVCGHGEMYHRESTDTPLHHLFVPMRVSDCIQCGGPIMKMEGNYTGKFHTAEDGKGKVHSECWHAFKEKDAEKCLHCKRAVMKWDGEFSGQYFPVGGAKVHTEVSWRAVRGVTWCGWAHYRGVGCIRGGGIC